MEGERMALLLPLTENKMAAFSEITGHPSSSFVIMASKRARYIIRLCMGIYSLQEYSAEIKFTKQYCYTYLHSVSSCCSMCIPGSFRALLSEL